MLVAQRLATENFALLESATLNNNTFYYILKITNLLDYFKHQGSVESNLRTLLDKDYKEGESFCFSDGGSLEVYKNEENARKDYENYVNKIKNPPQEEDFKDPEDDLIEYYVEKLHSVKFSKTLMQKELKNFYLESKNLEK